MTAKEYLSQAYRIDQRINSKLEQVSSLRELSTKATATFSDVPPSGTRNVHRLEDVILKIVSLEEEINHEIHTVIGEVRNPEYQTLLELRYLCFKSWEQIGVLMSYNTKYLFELHSRALKAVRVPQSPDEN